MTFLVGAFSLHLSTPCGSTHLLRMVVLIVGPKYLAEEVMIHLNHHLTRGLDPEKFLFWSKWHKMQRIYLLYSTSPAFILGGQNQELPEKKLTHPLRLWVIFQWRCWTVLGAKAKQMVAYFITFSWQNVSCEQTIESLPCRGLKYANYHLFFHRTKSLHWHLLACDLTVFCPGVEIHGLPVLSFLQANSWGERWQLGTCGTVPVASTGAVGKGGHRHTAKSQKTIKGPPEHGPPCYSEWGKITLSTTGLWEKNYQSQLGGSSQDL